MATTMTPMRRSLAYLRELGFYAEIVEHRVPYTNVTRDLLGFADVLALKLGEPPLLVQVTSSSNFAARKRKVLDAETLSLWFGVGGRVQVHGWGMAGRKGERRMVQVKIWEALREHLAA